MRLFSATEVERH